MKATGIVRRIDDLGRVVIPKEIRRTMRIREGDPLEIYTDREGEVRGRNAKIEEKLRRGGKNDGTANLGSKNGGSNAAKSLPDLGAIEQNYGAQTIWDRGGEKRRPIRQ